MAVAPARRRWLALSVLAVAQFMVFLDETVVNVALPSIKNDLGFSEAELSWVVSVYIVFFGGLVLIGGRAADLLGRRRMFVVGIAVFAVASLLDGLARSQATLLAPRALQGVGAALATPAALALVTALFSAGAERAKALSLWGALAGIGFAMGVLLGGVITQFLSWRWVFLVNVPVAAATLVLVPRLVAESRASRRGGFDLLGATVVTAGVMTLVFTVVKARDYGWTSVTTVAALTAGFLLLVLFAVIERRGTTPLIPRGFLRRRSAVVPNALQLLLTVSAISTLFLLTLYIQQVLGYGPLKAGVSYIPLAGGVAMATVVANQAVTRVSPRPLAAAGLGIAALGMALLGRAPVGGSYLTDVLPAMLIIGLGAGLTFVSITTAALERVDEETAGLASGLLSTSGQLGGALGVAVLASIVAARTADMLGAGSTPIAAEVSGLQRAFLVAAAVSLVASVIAAVALRREPGPVAGRAPTALPMWWMTGFATSPPSPRLALALEQAREVVRSYLSESEEHAWHNLLETQATIVRTLNRRLLTEHGLSYREMDALMHVAHAEDGTVGVDELARRMGVRLDDAARVIADLEHKGLVERRSDPLHTQGLVPAVTEAGETRLREAAPTYLSTLRSLFFDPLGPRDVRRLERICERIQAGRAVEDA